MASPPEPQRPGSGPPDWAYSLVVVLTLLGFPIALVLAWAFEVTPEGVQRTQTSEDGEEAAGVVRTSAWVGLGILVVLAGVGAYLVATPEAGTPDDPIEAVAQVEKLLELHPAGRGRGLLLDIERVRGNEEAAYEMLLSGFPEEVREEARDSLRAGGPASLVRLTTRLVDDRRAGITDPRVGFEPDNLGPATVWLDLPFWVGIDAGRDDQLIEFLESLVDTRDLTAMAVNMAVDPAFDPLRSDPRFQELLRRMNLSP